MKTKKRKIKKIKNCRFYFFFFVVFFFFFFLINESFFLFFFFFQAEDGIRDLYVTGVQTCALPISRLHDRRRVPPRVGRAEAHGPVRRDGRERARAPAPARRHRRRAAPRRPRPRERRGALALRLGQGRGAATEARRQAPLRRVR